MNYILLIFQCILLEDKSRKRYCIGCSEVDDGDTVKDNPGKYNLAILRFTNDKYNI